jgi:hypothetical protein
MKFWTSPRLAKEPGTGAVVRVATRIGCFSVDGGAATVLSTTGDGSAGGLFLGLDTQALKNSAELKTAINFTDISALFHG